MEWDCLDVEGRYQSNQSGRDIDMCPKIPSLSIQQTVGERQYLVDYAGLDREKESASENATRSIFGWLRVGGYAVDEKEYGTMKGLKSWSLMKMRRVKLALEHARNC